MKALITGISGQDGSYLAQFLLAKGYRVYGLVRRNPETCPNLQKLIGQVHFFYADMQETESLSTAIIRSWPDEIYNLAGQTFVPASWSGPERTIDINAGGLARILSIVTAQKPDTRVYQASSSEMFGDQFGELDETTPMLPTSPYGASKLCAHHLVQAYRHKGIKAVSGILFNHESERRGEEMVTMKISKHVARFACGIKEPLELGNIDAVRDWGYSPDYVEAMWMMLEKADADYVIGTGETHSVSEFLDASLDAVNIKSEPFRMQWLKCDKRLERNGEIHMLRANAARARTFLNWKPRVSFTEMVSRMVKSEIDKVLQCT